MIKLRFLKAVPCIVLALLAGMGLAGLAGRDLSPPSPEPAVSPPQTSLPEFFPVFGATNAASAKSAQRLSAAPPEVKASAFSGPQAVESPALSTAETVPPPPGPPIANTTESQPEPARRKPAAGRAVPPRDRPPLLTRPPRGMTPAQRAELVRYFREKGETELAEARAIAQAQGWSYRGEVNGRTYELAAIRDGKVYMDMSDNEDAAISSAASEVQAAPYHLTGADIVIGLWEAGGIAMSNHQEHAGRIIQMETDDITSHATHVAGTLVAAGVSNEAAGMAPEGMVYGWNTVTAEAEIIAWIMANPEETNNLQLSNHSYGSNSGWEDDYDPWRWYGKWPAAESDNFGIYELQTYEWDFFAYAAPYHLACKSAGNNRNDSAPTNGQSFQYYSGGWTTATYDDTLHPPEDGWDNGGYDTISPKGNAKNILTVGAVADAVSGGNRSLASADTTTFSGWGPTDDGRIKPDIVGNGQSLYSSDSGHPQDYSRKSGTSMSTPNVCGSTALLLEFYRSLFPDPLLASTLKALLLHTADDLGNPGPDYVYGWGLMNTHAAAEHLLDHYHNPDGPQVLEGNLNLLETNASHVFTWQSNGAIRATLCWTDPPGPVQSGVDSTNRVLVNDLDLVLLAPDGTEYLPWVLDPAVPTNPATTGVNVRDNVEQVVITTPAVPGTWTARVSIAASIYNDVQAYSLLITGHDGESDRSPRFLSQESGSSPVQFEWDSLTGRTYRVHRATNLLETNPFTSEIAVVTGGFISTSYTDTNTPIPDPAFYQVREE